MQFFGLNIYNGKYREFLDLIQNPQKKTLVFTPNPEILLRASQDIGFLEILKQADFLTPDANGLYTASLMIDGSGFFMSCIRTFFSKKHLSEKYGELIQGSNLTKDLVEFAKNTGNKIIFIDNYRIREPKNHFEYRKKQIQSQYPELFAQYFPGLDVTIIFDGEETPERLAEIIRERDIRFVFSCIGMKKQEARLIEIFYHLPANIRVVGLGVGSSFDYLLGLQKRAPLIFQKLGLEWLYRLMLSPRTRWHRIMDAFWRFPNMIKNSHHHT